jgi:hypothetical protein
MSADLMLVSSKKGQGFDSNPEKCVQIDETSGGEPWTDFGKMMSSNTYANIDDEFIKTVKHWYAVLEHGSYDEEKIINWLLHHKGVELQMEAW